jgi:hypothetical protein
LIHVFIDAGWLALRTILPKSAAQPIQPPAYALKDNLNAWTFAVCVGEATLFWSLTGYSKSLTARGWSRAWIRTSLCVLETKLLQGPWLTVFSQNLDVCGPRT